MKKEDNKEVSENPYDRTILEVLEYKADPGQEPIRVDKFLMDRMEKMTRNKLQKAIGDGWVMVNGKVVKSNHKIKPHDKIVVNWYKPRFSETPLPEDIPMDIRYEDEDVMIIYKEAGMIVHPGIGNNSGTIVNALMHHLSENLLKELDSERPGIVHRIDKNTTGLMVLAKTAYAATHLSKQFYDRTIERRYLALVWGNIEGETGTIRGNIGRHPRQRKVMHVFEEEEGIGKHAVTHYEVVERFGYVTLVRCKLETGRTHQIRVHFKHIGHPLFGDVEYGGDKIIKGTIFSKYRQFVLNCFKLMPNQALHAYSLGFEHPTTGEHIYQESELPPNFEELIDKWRRYTQGRIKM